MNIFKRKTRFDYRIDSFPFPEAETHQMDLEDAINNITSTVLIEGTWRLHSVVLQGDMAIVICERELEV